MKTYSFRAVRKSDGAEIHSYFIHDLKGAGMDAMAETVRTALIASHPLASGLMHDDIELEMSERSESNQLA